MTWSLTICKSVVYTVYNFFLLTLGLPYSFLVSNAENWELNNKYLKAREAIINIKITNDLAVEVN